MRRRAAPEGLEQFGERPEPAWCLVRAKPNRDSARPAAGRAKCGSDKEGYVNSITWPLPGADPSAAVVQGVAIAIWVATIGLNSRSRLDHLCPCSRSPLADDKPFELELPSEHTAFAFVHTGAVTIENKTIDAGNLAILGRGNRLRLQARDVRSGVLIAAGKPLREPIVQRGPFVMNTEEEIRKAFAEYRAGTLDT